MKLEICVDSYASLQNALAHGADRIELCSALSLGGLSPTPGTLLSAAELGSGFRAVCTAESCAEHCSKPLSEYNTEHESSFQNNDIQKIFVMVRPRAGDFLYTDAEFEVMLREVRTIKKLGFPGIVVGMLTPDGNVDVLRLAALVEEARPMSITFHRAFDNGADPKRIIEDLISLGIDRVLTSGQAATASEGAALIRELQEIYGKQIVIMPGSGITSSNLEELIRFTRCTEYHLSAKKWIPSQMQFKKSPLPISDDPSWFNDAEEICKAKEILSRYSNHMKSEFHPKHDPDFLPMILLIEQYRKLLKEAHSTSHLTFSILRNHIPVRTFKINILNHSEKNDSNAASVSEPHTIPEQDISLKMNALILKKYSAPEMTMLYVERIIKTYLWIVGGNGISIDGPKYLFDYIHEQYRTDGARDFDVTFFSDVFGKKFDVEALNTEKQTNPNADIDMKIHSSSKAADISPSRVKKSLRIGLDLGGSTLKLTMLEGENILCQTENMWTPKTEQTPDYHFHKIVDAIRNALAITQKSAKEIECIGFSSAGIVLQNRIITGSLFRCIPSCLKAKSLELFENISKEFGCIPYSVVNDGEISALAAKTKQKNCSVLGLTLGTSLGCGYLDENGKLTNHINELAFVPLDLSPSAIIDEWSKDKGVGVSYLSQDAVIKLALRAGLSPQGDTPSQQFHSLTNCLNPNPAFEYPSDTQIRKTVEEIFEDIGIYLAYSIAYYRELFDFQSILLLGGVIAGEHGKIILQSAKNVLRHRFPSIYDSLEFLSTGLDTHLQDYVAANISSE